MDSFLTLVSEGLSLREASRMCGRVDNAFRKLFAKDNDFRLSYLSARDVGETNRMARAYWKNPGRGRRPPIRR